MRVTAVNGQTTNGLTCKEVGAAVLQSSPSGRCRLSLMLDEESYTKVVMMLRSLNDADDSDEEEDYIYDEMAALSTQFGQHQPKDSKQRTPATIDYNLATAPELRAINKAEGEYQQLNPHANYAHTPHQSTWRPRMQELLHTIEPHDPHTPLLLPPIAVEVVRALVKPQPR